MDPRRLLASAALKYEPRLLPPAAPSAVSGKESMFPSSSHFGVVGTWLPLRLRDLLFGEAGDRGVRVTSGSSRSILSTSTLTSSSMPNLTRTLSVNTIRRVAILNLRANSSLHTTRPASEAATSSLSPATSSACASSMVVIVDSCSSCLLLSSAMSSSTCSFWSRFTERSASRSASTTSRSCSGTIPRRTSARYRSRNSALDELFLGPPAAPAPGEAGAPNGFLRTLPP
mmetsp:Transcript_28049/g.64689  ORF Transcript_28049/g.64689 Transcript_28049/m.64689 type:complete len:229 (-) Transcript_28049:2133-2819(-)